MIIGFLASWGSRGSQEPPGRLREAQEGPGRPQEQLRNERREFQENPVFRPWEASGGLRGTQNRWGGLAGAKGKPRLSLALGPPLVRVFKLFPSAPSRLFFIFFTNVLSIYIYIHICTHMNIEIDIDIYIYM